MKSQLIKRTYRINKEHDKLVKKHSKNHGSESSVIRHLIGELDKIPKIIA